MAAPESKGPWWQKWWVLTGAAFFALFVLLMIVGVILVIASPPLEGDTQAADLSSTTTELLDTTTVAEPDLTEPPVETAAVTTAASETTTSTTTTTVPSTTTTSTTSTTTTSTTTTTEVVLTVDDVREFVFPISFESNRDEVLVILSDLFIVKTVDRYDYNSESGVVGLNITPEFDFDEGVRDDAWEITRAMAVLWSDTWYEPVTGFSPLFDISISSAQYACSGDQMRQISDARFSRQDWETGCRVR